MLAHQIDGDGPLTVALLHGVGGGRSIWDTRHSGTAAALAAAGFRVIALDLPGYGGSPLSTAGPPPLSTAGMARAVANALQALNARPAVLLGHSMGGMVAQELWVQDPQAVCALVLACSSPAFGKPDGAWQQAFLNSRLAPLDAGEGMPALAQRLVAGMVAPGCPPDVQARGAAVMAQVPEATYRAALQAIVGFDRRAGLPTITVPTLCLAAEHDRTAPPEVMQRMAERIPGGTYACIGGAGHLANVEQPQAFADAVTAFLRQHLGAP
ncbi:MAG: alpha/beta hydrolase [Rubrivivax sp.]|nr:alpha/beta hydrolase [Rubrivivax sp.]